MANYRTTTHALRVQTNRTIVLARHLLGLPLGLCILCSFATGCALDGPSVVPASIARDKIYAAAVAKLALCGYPDSVLLGIASNLTFISSDSWDQQAYFATRDVDYCLERIWAAPCDSATGVSETPYNSCHLDKQFIYRGAILEGEVLDFGSESPF